MEAAKLREWIAERRNLIRQASGNASTLDEAAYLEGCIAELYELEKFMNSYDTVTRCADKHLEEGLQRFRSRFLSE